MTDFQFSHEGPYCWSSDDCKVEIYWRHLLGKSGWQYRVYCNGKEIASEMKDTPEEAVDAAKVAVARHLAVLESIANSCRDVLAQMSLKKP